MSFGSGVTSPVQRYPSAAVLFTSTLKCDVLQPFKRYVEIGRVALVNYEKDYGKLVVIDQNRALVDAPDMVRSQINFKRLSLTDIKININRVPKKKNLIEAMEKAERNDVGIASVIQK